ncbi:MAG: response regulator [Candidatus Competibacteraceae bacterium]|nr:response regulator [Candidatus Competibacteraceae bacterium]
MDQESILIVEDDRIIAAYLQDTLTRLGDIVPEPVATGKAAVARAVAAPPDLVLMDIQMAGAMDGANAAERIRMAFDIPIV